MDIYIYIYMQYILHNLYYYIFTERERELTDFYLSLDLVS